MNKKGQALIEFVLLLPVILILIFSTIDVLNLVLQKNDLNNKVNDQLSFYNNKKISKETMIKNLSNNNIIIDEVVSDNYLVLNISKKASFISPITNGLLKNYTIKIKRVIPLE